MAFQRITMKLVDRATGAPLVNHSVLAFVGQTCFDVSLSTYSDSAGQNLVSVTTDPQGSIDFWVLDIHTIDLLISNSVGERVSHITVKGSSMVDVQSASHLSDIEINAVRQSLGQGPGTGGSVLSVNGRQGAVILVKADVGLDAVNNTADADKPLSATALAANATLATYIGEKLDASAVSTWGLAFVASEDVAQARENLSLGSAALSPTSAFASAIHAHPISEVSGLTASLSAVDGQLTGLTTQVGALTTGLTSIQIQVTALVAQNSTQDAALSSLTTQVSATQSQIVAAQSSISTLQASITTLQATDVSIQTTLSSVQTSISTLQGQVSALTTSVASAVSSIADLVAAAPKVDIVEKTSSYTLVLADAGKQFDMNVATSNSLTVPNDSAVNFPTGTRISICQAGAGVTSIVAGASVVFKKPSTVGLNLSEKDEIAMLHKTGPNTWRLNGALNVL